jgi:anti-sigma regulatory factor (Ser/Thr protein kinase)
VGRDDLVASAAYQPEPTAVAAARRFVRDTLQAWVVTGAAADGHGLVDDAVLLTSELVTNAVVHAGTPVVLTCKLADGSVEVAVSDGHPGRFVPEPAATQHSRAERTSGRGLLLPAALASAWGVTYGRSSKAVWFRLAAPGTAVGGGAVPGTAVGGAAVPGTAVGDGAAGDRGAGDDGGPAPAAELAAAAPWAAGDGGFSSGAAGEDGYLALLAATLESVRSAVGADAVLALMADEDGDLRVRAVAGGLPPGAQQQMSLGAALGLGAPAGLPGGLAPSVATVPFLADGTVIGLLTAVSGAAAAFSESDAGRLQRLADAWGAPLHRAWLGELERLRRVRLAALADARGLLAGDLSQDEVMALAGKVAVPRLAPWCAVLLPAAASGLRPVYVHHVEAGRTAALTRLLDRMGQAVTADVPARHCAGGGPGRRVPLTPPGAGSAQDAAWCFPLGGPGAAQPAGHGLFVVGQPGRMPREVAALAADLALRVGNALSRERLVSQEL